MITSRTALHENIIVAYSRLLTVIRSEDIVLRCFRFLRTMESGHCAQHQNLSSGQHAPHPSRQAYHGTIQSQSVGITCLIGIFHRKAVIDVAMLKRRLIPVRMSFVTLNLSFEFYTILWAFDKQFVCCVDTLVPKEIY